MAGQVVSRAAKPEESASACVLLLDNHRTRRMQVASMFRSAGCLVVAAASESDVTRTLTANVHSWVLVVVDGSQIFCDGHPRTPVVHLGGRNAMKIAGRITMPAAPSLSTDVHAIVGLLGIN